MFLFMNYGRGKSLELNYATCIRIDVYMLEEFL